MEPQQELFTALLLALRQEYDVYDGFLPPEDTPYPFVYLADTRMSDGVTKTQLLGTVYQNIHVWHDSPLKRGTVSAMLSRIKAICRSLERTGTFKWMVTDINQTIIHDETTKTPLVHGVLEVTFRLMGGTQS